jgi:NIMA (never in mitosis gene a)-related kinase 1/4/5
MEYADGGDLLQKIF